MKVHETFPLKIFSPFKVFFEGEALAMSAVNASGPFDILAKHEDFLTILTPCNIVVQTVNGKKEIPMERAIVQVIKDRVWVFANI
jgi:F-type H+-transporting ATPase subunit epsilon